jgi:hypothetical protein
MAGVVRDRNRQAGRPRCHEQPLRWRAQWQCCWPSRQDCAAEGDMSFDIGQCPRERIARARLDPHVLGPHRKAEHDQSIRPFLCEEHGQVPIDRAIANAENMREATNIGKGRVASVGKLLRQGAGRIKGGARKRTKAGEKDGKSHTNIIGAGAAMPLIYPAWLQFPPPPLRPSCAPRRPPPRAGAVSS